LELIEKQDLKTCWNNFWGLDDLSIYYDKYYPKYLKSLHKNKIIT